MMSSKLNAWGSRVALVVGVLGAALLASCGGGGELQSFNASRVIAFGDETSVINADHSKYTVNALATDGTTLDCVSNPIWVQAVANIYGLVFPECAGTVAAPVSRIYATPGAQVADLETQINLYVAAGGVADGDMVTVLVGVNDVVAQFAQYPAVDEAQLLANVDAAGRALADQVNRLADMGARVLVSNIPNVGRMPIAGDRTDPTNPSPPVLADLSDRFNKAMQNRLNNDGHKIGLIQLKEYLVSQDNATQGLGGGSFTNTTQPACLASAPLPTCTTATLDPLVGTGIWLWADNLHLGITGHAALGALAVSRAQNNPF